MNEEPQTPRLAAGDEPRFLRNRDLVDQTALNAYPVVIVGVGAIGSELAVQLVRLGVRQLTLIDADQVNEHNLALQGYDEAELGQPKVTALAARLARIRTAVNITARVAEWHPDLCPPLPTSHVLFSTVDAIGTRSRLFAHELLPRRAVCLFDARMSSEAFEAYCVPCQEPALIQAYRASLFAPGEALEEPCTARGTCYCATIAAACLAAMFKRWTMRACGGYYHSLLRFDLKTFDLLQADLSV
jgi:hypothetical protein